MPLNVLATVSDVVSECNGAGTGPYSLFNIGGVTSGQIYDKLTEANATLQGWVSIGGPPTSADNATTEMQKRFEVTYASARLASDLLGGTITDGFNFTIEGTNIQRFGAQFQTYTKFIKDHLDIANFYIKMLHQWFIVYNSSFPEGSNEMGAPVGYWRTGNPRWG